MTTGTLTHNEFQRRMAEVKRMMEGLAAELARVTAAVDALEAEVGTSTN